MRPIEPLEYLGNYNKKYDEWKNLDVSALHAIIFKDILELNKEDIFKKGPIFYSHDAKNCIDQLDNNYNWVFFIRPTKMSQLINIADNSETMPPKSTFFYPKYLSGFINANLE